jgi:hypothetical protein
MKINFISWLVLHNFMSFECNFFQICNYLYNKWWTVGVGPVVVPELTRLCHPPLLWAERPGVSPPPSSHTEPDPVEFPGVGRY